MSTVTSPLPSNPARALLRFGMFIVWTLMMLPTVLISYVLRAEVARRCLVQIYLRGVLTILGMELHVKGALSTERPLMVVSNHTSYLDIFIIGALAPVSFTPKREIRSWPVVGFMCVLADCVFVERRKGHMQEARDEMAKRIEGGKVLCLFPEGTTSDGKHLKPFKSGFISLAEDHKLPLQPLTIAYTTVNGKPIADEQRDQVAWVGESTLLGHGARFLGFKHTDVTVLFHPVERLETYGDRKALTEACRTIINASLQDELVTPVGGTTPGSGGVA